MYECEITAGEFVEPAGDAAEVLQLAEQALDARALLVEAPVGFACRGAGRMGWDDSDGTLLFDPVEDGVAVIRAIGEHRLNGDHRDRAEQGDGLGRVAGLARREGEAERVAEAVRYCVQLAGIATPRTPKALLSFTFFAPAAQA